MSKGTKTRVVSSPSATSPLALAATALDAELRRYLDLAAAAKKVPLTSEKGLDRAAKALVEAAESQERVAGHVRALVDAIRAARESQERAAAELAAHAQVVEARGAELRGLLEQFSALGEQARELNTLVVGAATYKPDPYGGEAQEQDMATRFAPVFRQMDVVADRAQELARAADAKQMVDLARQADGLRQQLLSARNKLQLFQKSLPAKPAP